MKQKLIFTELVGETLDGLVAETGTSQVIVIADTNTVRLVLPRLAEQSKTASTAKVITVEAGDDNKTLDSLTGIWQKLSELEATRNSMVVNLGGGMVSDLGGFAAATFKRGMRCVNIPTTLLAAVDASVGGKTGINFNGFKNQVGAFAEPVASIISTTYFDTLPREEILSGYGEMLKHGLLEGPDAFAKLLMVDPEELVGKGAGLLGLLERSVMVKSRIVAQDPTEAGLRKALNLGHTVGHAFEAYSYRRNKPVPHGYAVAWGLIVELVLSHMYLGFPTEPLHQLADYVYRNYGAFALNCDDYEALTASMRQDKKNARADQINFTLLSALGQAQINQTVPSAQIGAALDIYRDLMHL